jgi:putative spermidine/putrescine transport system ATP-binding protein
MLRRSIDGGGMAAAAHALKIEHLSKHYGATPAVDDVSFSIAKGQFLTLLGPSGSGKTTILMAIAGFVEPSAGKISVDDRPITHLPPEKRNFGMVFQGYALFPHLSVKDNVAFPLKIRKRPAAEIAERVRRALDLVQLGALAERLPKQLSGGQQQRVALARALVFEPDVLLLDEPLSALDKKLRAELQEELKELHRRVGKTFVYVTHDQEEALSMSDEIAIIRAGRLVQKGPPRLLYDAPKTHFVADFLGRSNFISGAVAGAANDGFAFAAGGAMLEQAGAAPPGGAPVLVALRPEKIAVALEPPQTHNRAQGQIAGWTYLGTNFHAQIETQLGAIAVTLPTWRCDVEPRQGLPVWIGWDADASVVVEDDR